MKENLFHVTGSQICAGQSEAPIYIYYIYTDSYLSIGLLLLYWIPIYISDSYLYIGLSCLHMGEAKFTAIHVALRHLIKYS